LSRREAALFFTGPDIRTAWDAKAICDWRAELVVREKLLIREILEAPPPELGQWNGESLTDNL